MNKSRAFLLLVVGFIVAAPGPAIAETRTLSWSPVTAYTDGTPIETTKAIAYTAYWTTDPGLSVASLRMLGAGVTQTSLPFDPDVQGMPRGQTAYFTLKTVLSSGEESELAPAYSWVVPVVSGPSLSTLSISGPSSVNENGSATYAATATWSDGTTSSVVPSWSENSSYASISAGGVLSAGSVTANQPVTVSASYTAGGVTRTASASVTIVDVPPTLSSLSMSGPSSVNENGSATYAATATWSDGTTSSATAASSWSTTLGTISAGVLTSPSVTGNQTAIVLAGYASGGVTRTAQMTVTILNVATLSGLTIIGPASVNEGDTANYVATAAWSDGTSTTVTAIASWATTLGTIGSGTLAAPSVTATQTATVSASYTSGGATRTAQLAVTIADVPATTPAAPENLDVSGPVAMSPTTQFRMTWNPVTTYADGSAIAAGSVTYTAYWSTDPALSEGTLQPLVSSTSTTSVDFDPAAKGMKKNQRIYLTTKAVHSSGKQSSLAGAVSWRVSNAGPVPPANGRIYKK